MNEALGQQLRQARESRQLNLEQVSRATHMRVHYLKSMEAGDFEALPSLAQARGFLRTYAQFLGLDAPDLLTQLEQSEGSRNTAPALQNATAKKEDTIPVPLPAETEQILQEIGQKLQRQRERLGLSLEDVEKYTHLRIHYLQALESGALDNLPSPVQGRGMLKNYSTFLGLEPDPLLLRFAESLQLRLAAVQQITRPANRPAPTRRAKGIPGPLQRIFSREYLLIGLLVLGLVLFAAWAAIQIFTTRLEQAPSPTSPSIAEILLAPSTATATPSPVPETPTPVLAIIGGEGETEGSTATPELLPLPANIQGVQLYVTVGQRAFMQVLVDGEVEFTGRVLPGSAYNFQGAESVEIITGNGAAIQVFYNQQDLGPLGLFGEVVDRVFTAEGILTPTPTITPTSTATSRPSPTSPPSATPTGPIEVLP